MRPFFLSNVRRQDDVVTGSDIPDSCYDACNNAALEAQKSGKDPALCDEDSTFITFLHDCTACVEQTTESGNASGDLIPPDFDQWVNYCASLGNGTDQVDAVQISTLLASYSSLVASQSALEESLSSKGYNLSTTTDSPTTTTPETRPTLTASQTAASSPDADTDGSDTNSPNTKVIVPAVVVPVVCFIAAAAVIWALMRRRRRRQMQQNNGDADGFDGKAQLHADEFRPELEAVTAVKEKSTDPDENSVVAELPAQEPVGSEMDATNQTAERRASS